MKGIIYNMPTGFSPDYFDWVIETREKHIFNLTWPEVKCGNLLYRYKVKFVPQAPFHINDKVYFADFYLPEHDAIIELDGMCHETTSLKDIERDEAFSSIGITTYRMNNEDLCKDSIRTIVGPVNPRVRRYKTKRIIVTRGKVINNLH